jgi:mono/diheme cytochrome c family protein
MSALVMRTRNVWAVVLASALTTVMRSDAALPSAAVERSRPDAIDGPQTATVSFTKDIAPIVFDHCAGCHRPGGDGPFSLLTYDDVKARARLIVKATASRFMPPWKPEPGYGTFAAVRRLSDEHIQLIRRWVDQGTIQGDLADLPPLPESQVGQKWRLGEPDLIVRLPAYTPAAPRCFGRSSSRYPHRSGDSSERGSSVRAIVALCTTPP